MSKSGIEVEDYSEKSFVVRGDTQQYKDDLKAFGGKWNSRLTDRNTGEHFGAWIYPMSKKNQLLSWVSGAKPEREAPKFRPAFENTVTAESFTCSSTFEKYVTSELKKINTKLDRNQELLLKLVKSLSVEEEDESSEDEVAPTKRLMKR